jgi:hypothetical protein
VFITPLLWSKPPCATGVFFTNGPDLGGGQGFREFGAQRAIYRCFRGGHVLAPKDTTKPALEVGHGVDVAAEVAPVESPGKRPSL